jgi:hypothetical protein
MSLSCILDGILGSRQAGNVLVPVGQSYETLEPVIPNLLESNPFWLILGPMRSGKSNFLACTAISVLKQEANDWMITGYAFRRSPLNVLGQRENQIKVLNTAEDIIKDCQAMTEKLQTGQPIGNGKRVLLLVDDLGFPFQPGKESLLNALNTLAQNLESTTDVFIMATGLLDELRIQITSTFLKLLRQGRTGMVLSKDINELDWLGAQISLEYRRMDLPLGRGFFVNKGKAQMVQTPLQDGGK